ncbi:MAG: hypothetical protein ACJAYG_000257 [Oceanicoccus sp.]|jgi:uncharacterized protein YjeT (DUF2065 family)
MWQNLLIALCLVLVLEGIMPFVNPKSWRQTIVTIAQLDDRALRIMGLVSMLIGVGLLYLVNG